MTTVVFFKDAVYSDRQGAGPIVRSELSKYIIDEKNGRVWYLAGSANVALMAIQAFIQGKPYKPEEWNAIDMRKHSASIVALEPDGSFSHWTPMKTKDGLWLKPRMTPLENIPIAPDYDHLAPRTIGSGGPYFLGAFLAMQRKLKGKPMTKKDIMTVLRVVADYDSGTGYTFNRLDVASRKITTLEAK